MCCMEGRSMDKKFCVHCGAEVNPQAVVCIHCGCSLPNIKKTYNNNGNSDTKEIFNTLIKVFMIIGIITSAFALIPLIWCIPMYKKVNGYLEGGEPLSVGYKVCVLLFVNFVAGILLLIEDSI